MTLDYFEVKQNLLTGLLKGINDRWCEAYAEGDTRAMHYYKKQAAEAAQALRDTNETLRNFV